MVFAGLFGKGDFSLERAEVALALLLAGICFLFPSAAKPFVDTFAYGASYAKVFAFGAYLLLAVALSKSRACKKISWLNERAVVGALLVLFAYGFLGYYWFVEKIGGTLSEKYFAYNQEGYTSSHVLHNHVLKTAFCFLNLPADRYDCSAPFLAFIPQFYAPIGTVLVFLASIICAAYFSRLEGAGERLAYLILSFSALKTAVDGGFFNYENISFFILVPFLLFRKNRLAASFVGFALWIPLAIATYSFYDPFRLATPFFVFFFPLYAFFQSPKKLFPLLALSLIAPSFHILSSEAIEGRWSLQECQNAGLSRLFEQVVHAHQYAGCEAEVELSCGRVEAQGSAIVYFGKAAKKPELLISKSLAGKCRNGVFSIERIEGSIVVFERKKAGE
ncbi:MAG: hypothetical protein N3G22_01890 [Candidatus Micrarchaeota archaeon]|nr:hypothetical protein [Candidatus Micrarchaeota archaeon]